MNVTSCLKLDNWRRSGGHYYRQFPCDSTGNDDPGAPWVEISRQVYVADVGTILRSSGQLTGGVLSVAWLPSGGLSAIRRDR